MIYLMDTHMFLWFTDGADDLPQAVRVLIENTEHDLHVSIVSFWEMGIKASIGKLPLNNTLSSMEAAAQEQAIQIAPVTIRAIEEMQRLPFHHKDPFDRLIATTALTLGAVLLSADTTLMLIKCREHGGRTSMRDMDWLSRFWLTTPSPRRCCKGVAVTPAPAANIDFGTKPPVPPQVLGSG